MNEEKALNYIINCLRRKRLLKTQSYGYEIHLHRVIRYYVRNIDKLHGAKANSRIKELYPCFYAAAWDLCRRGILNHGVWMPSETPAAGDKPETAYTLTNFTKTWLVDSCREDMVPDEPEHFEEMLASFDNMMDFEFHEQASLAFRRYREYAYDDCCAICGSAAESITLALAVSKQGGKKDILERFRSADGRNEIEDMIIGKEEKSVQLEFLAYAAILSHWEKMSHERVSRISRKNAYTALAMLLSFAQFATNHWPDALEAIQTKRPCRGSATSTGPINHHPLIMHH